MQVYILSETDYIYTQALGVYKTEKQGILAMYRHFYKPKECCFIESAILDVSRTIVNVASTESLEYLLCKPEFDKLKLVIEELEASGESETLPILQEYTKVLKEFDANLQKEYLRSANRMSFHDFKDRYNLV